jgi:hypothetical protein
LALKNDLTSLLTQQAVLALNTQADTLSRIEASLAKNRTFYAAIRDGNEDSAITFVSSHGGEEAVRRVSAEVEVSFDLLLHNFWI